MSKNNIIEKAHQVGDVHPKNPKLVWTQLPSGKYDWRTKKASAGGNDNGGGQNKGGGDDSNKWDNLSHDELVAFAKKTKSEALARVASNKNLKSNVRQIAYDEYKTRSDFDESKVDISDLKGNGGANKPSNSGNNPKPQQNNDSDDNGGSGNQQPQKKDDEDDGASKAKPAKVQYNNKPNVDITIPKTFVMTLKNGKRKTLNTKEERKKLEGYSEDILIGIVNAKKVNPILRHIAWEEAASRGIDESKLDVSGTLKDHWDVIETRQNVSNRNTMSDDDEDSGEYYDPENPMNFDPERAKEIMENFPDGDDGWKNPKDKRVREAFNNFTSLNDRKAYDRFYDYQKRQDPDYEAPNEVIADLNADYLNFMVSDVSPLFISAGGAGAGKTYGFKKLAEELNIQPLQEGQDPSDEDWGYVKLTNPKSEKDFLQMLKKYNGTYLDPVDGEEHGHILVFDDNDHILTHSAYQALMKNLADTDPDARLFKDPDTGNMIKFTGKIMVITNKTMDSLADDEDGKAILSRAEKSDIHFTVNENLEVLTARYKTMDVDGLKIPKDKEPQIREEVYNFIKDNADKLDPSKFTVRKFGEVMKNVQKMIIRDMYSQRSSTIGNLTGGKSKAWQQTAMKILNKANDDELNSNKDSKKPLNPKVKERMELIKKKNPKLYEQLWGKKALEILNGDDEDEEEETAKAMFNEMSLEDAENLIFG